MRFLGTSITANLFIRILGCADSAAPMTSVLQTGMTRDNALAPMVMGLVAIPVYVTPTDVMMHFGTIVRDGYSLGAAFALIVLGAGANVGVANWLRRDYGLRPLLLFVSLLIGSTMAIGLTADRTIVHGNATMKDHTHAFDAIRVQDVTEFQRRSTQWKRHPEKLPTSAMIRGGPVTAAGREYLAELLYGLSTLEEHMLSGQIDEAEMVRSYVDGLYRKCCDEFRLGNT